MRRSVAAAIALGLTLVGGLAALRDGQRDDAVSPPDAVAQAAGIVRAQFAAGDAVRVEPPWDASAWWGLQGAGPGAEAFPFPAFFVNDGLDPVDLLDHERLWVIGLHHREPALPAVLGGAGELEERVDLEGGVSVARYRLARAPHLRSMTGDFATLRVARRTPEGEVKPCPFRAGRHHCGREPWYDLHIQERDVHHLDVAWVFAHPGPDRVALEITWPDLPAGTWLVLRAGFTLEAVRRDPGSDTAVWIDLDGQPADAFTLRPHEYRLERRLIALPPRDAPYAVRVVVAADDAAWRELMLQGQLFEAVPEAISRVATPGRPPE